MAQQIINNGDTGLQVRDKINQNLAELYAKGLPTTVANLAARWRVFTWNYVVWSYVAPVTWNLTAAVLTGAVEWATVYVYHESATQPTYSWSNYVWLEGYVYYPNALNLIELTYKNWKVLVSIIRVDRINVPTPLTIAWAATHNVWQVITPDYTINIRSIQRQISNDNITFTNIVGATSNTYTLIAWQESKYVRFQATYQDDTWSFDSWLLTSNSKLINAVVELVTSGYNMVDVAAANGRADWIIAQFDWSGNTTYTVPNDGLNLFTNGYQRVTASTATWDIHFMSIAVDTSHEPSNKLLINTSYKVKIKYRSDQSLRILWAGWATFQTVTNNTYWTVSAGGLNLPINTWNAVEWTFDILTSATVLSNLQIQFFTSQVAPSFYEFQVSISQN